MRKLSGFVLGASLALVDGPVLAELAPSPEPPLPSRYERLAAYRTCRALFARLGADGPATLAATSYYAASPSEERRYCRGTSHALTRVGNLRVGLCRSFGRLRKTEAAVLLIHEALHSAGQGEYPADARAPDSIALTRMVTEGCRIF
jgi:hypothetical protein